MRNQYSKMSVTIIIGLFIILSAVCVLLLLWRGSGDDVAHTVSSSEESLQQTRENKGGPRAGQSADQPAEGEGEQKVAGDGVLSLKLGKQDKLTSEEYAENPDRWVPSPANPEKLGGSTCPYNFMYDKKTRIAEKNSAGKPNDVPMLELRFRQEEDGKIVPCLLESVMFLPFEDGRTIPVTGKELGGVDLDQSRYYPSIRGGYGCRVLLALTRNPENVNRILAMGQKYYVQFRQHGFETRYDTPEKYGSRIIQIPRVGRGEVAVMEVEVTGKQGEKWRRPSYEKVTVKVDRKLGSEKLYLHFQDPGRKKWYYDKIEGSNQETIKVRQLGGEMTVTGEHKIYSYYYVREIKSHTVNLPEDADIVASDDTVVPFRLKVPKDALPDSAVRLWILVEKDDLVPVTDADPRNFTGYHEYTMADTVELSYVPGRYCVAYVEEPPSKPQILGTVKIERTDDGRILEVQSSKP